MMANKGITREELITSEEFQIGNIQNDLYTDIRNYLKKNRMSQAKLAHKLGVGESYVSQILKEDYDHKISKLIQLYNTIGKVVIRVETEDIDAYLAADFENRSDQDRLELTPISMEKAHSGPVNVPEMHQLAMSLKFNSDSPNFYHGKAKSELSVQA